MDKIEPKYRKEVFTCPYCRQTARQQWDINLIENIVKKRLYGFTAVNPDNEDNLLIEKRYSIKKIDDIYFVKMTGYNPDATAVKENKEDEDIRHIGISTCSTCGRMHVWLDGKMIDPRKGIIPSPNEDMSDSIKEIYNEAAEVIEISPKSSGALLRLALQKFLKEQLETKGDNINDDIKKLVSEGKVDETIQRTLDFIRVIGNNAVHPLQINLEENKDHVIALFTLFNLIVSETISKKKEVENRYNSLPESVLKVIEKRDKK